MYVVIILTLDKKLYRNNDKINILEAKNTVVFMRIIIICIEFLEISFDEKNVLIYFFILFVYEYKRCFRKNHNYLF